MGNDAQDGVAWIASGETVVAEQHVARRLAAILCADVAGYTRLTGADEEGTIARLRALRHELIDPLIATHRGRVVKRTGDGTLVEFSSVVDALRCAIEVQRGLAPRNAVLPEAMRILFRVGINVGDVVVEGDDLLGDTVNIAARLEGIAEPGGICLSEDAWRQVKDRVAADYVDRGEQSLKNVARPVRVFSVGLPGPVAALPAAAPTLPDRPSIAVLPFQNMSGDADQEYFCDGMVEDIITGLSRIKWLLVIARNSSFVYKGKPIDVKQVGRELDVRYVLEGSVRKAGNRVRITGQLVEAQSGAHLWAERYDRPLDDIFALQDEITLAVVGAIEPSLRTAEIERVKRKRPDSLDAYDLVLRALPLVEARNPQEVVQAIPLLERAIDLDPRYTLAHGLLAQAHHLNYHFGARNEEDRAAAVTHAQVVLAIGADDAEALAYAAFVIAQTGHDMATAIDAFERAIALSPSLAIAHSTLAVALTNLGKAKEAIEPAERAIRLSPHGIAELQAYGALCGANFLLERYPEAVAAGRRQAQGRPRFAVAHFILAACLGRMGHIEEAKECAARGIALDPDFTMPGFVRRFLMAPDVAAKWASALRDLGLPE
jgi:adenylate cyclase